MEEYHILKMIFKYTPQGIRNVGRTRMEWQDQQQLQWGMNGMTAYHIGQIQQWE
jgi:hypothetical protein